jgi:hypothetical protein
MLPDEAPKCLCGTKQWNPGGASFSPGLQSQWFTCTTCKRPALDIGNGGGHAFIISTVANDDFPQEGLQWINSILLLVWRDVFGRLTAARNAMEQKVCASFCRDEGLAQGTKIDEMDTGQTERFRAMWDVLRKDDRWRKPVGFENQGLPPMVPQCITVFHPMDDGEWLMIDHAKTAEIAVPADPIRVHHDTYFNEVFAKLEDELGKIERTEVKNEYCGAENEPWYQFSIGKVVFTVGPRKRVIAVKITAPEGINTDAIRSVAQADRTTYMADGDWQSDAIIATAIEVHAWTKEKLIEYLTILGRENATA